MRSDNECYESVNNMDNQLQIPRQLSENTIFEGLTLEEIQSILPCIALSVKSYGSEECVIDKGESVQNLYVVLDGELSICDETREGKRTTVANIEKNELFGESVLFSSSKLPHRVIAQKDAQVLYLSGDFFLNTCAKGECGYKLAHQKIVKNMLRLLSDRALLLGKKIAYLTASDLKTKIAMYLYELYDVNGSLSFHMPLNRDRLAEFFDVARPSLSRELVNLKNQGIIDFYRSNITILDIDALHRLAQGDSGEMGGES